MKDFNEAIMQEFRANGGKVGAFGDAPLVILHTIGAKSGELREIPLVALRNDDGDFVFASAAGSPKHPDWYHNLKANPEIDVEFGADRFAAVVSQLEQSEGDAKLQAQASLIPQFADYVESAAPRKIPVFHVARA